ncbi:MAG: hypothetical protein ACRC11_01070, partial [Xenococcaceae cyanobacterium]
ISIAVSRTETFYARNRDKHKSLLIVWHPDPGVYYCMMLDELGGAYKHQPVHVCITLFEAREKGEQWINE